MAEVKLEFLPKCCRENSYTKIMVCTTDDGRTILELNSDAVYGRKFLEWFFSQPLKIKGVFTFEVSEEALAFMHVLAKCSPRTWHKILDVVRDKGLEYVLINTMLGKK